MSSGLTCLFPCLVFPCLTIPCLSLCHLISPLMLTRPARQEYCQTCCQASLLLIHPSQLQQTRRLEGSHHNSKVSHIRLSRVGGGGLKQLCVRLNLDKKVPLVANPLVVGIPPLGKTALTFVPITELLNIL